MKLAPWSVRFLCGLAMVTGCNDNTAAGTDAGASDAVAADAGPDAATRSFFMGTTPIGTSGTTFPSIELDHLADGDLVSLHIDDFWGIPWDAFAAGAAPPAPWADRWSSLAAGARATGKPLYLALSPLGGRVTLAPNVDPSGNPRAGWAPTDASGCYDFSSAPAAGWRDAYVRYVRYVVDLVRPDYLSPGLEVNVLFTKCPSQKDYFMTWYAGVHSALKAAYPSLPIFPTVQMEHLYGIAEPAASCGAGMSDGACFDEHLTAVLRMPGDRIAFSIYPQAWDFVGRSMPADTFSKVRTATTRPIWISESGWNAVPVLSAYGTQPAQCGSPLVPASSGNDDRLSDWLSTLLSAADAHSFEAVVWWEDRDLFDGEVASQCPCPGINDTCSLLAAFRSVSSATEIVFRLFGNMGLRHHNGSPRPALATWMAYLARPRTR